MCGCELPCGCSDQSVHLATEPSPCVCTLLALVSSCWFHISFHGILTWDIEFNNNLRIYDISSQFCYLNREPNGRFNGELFWFILNRADGVMRTMNTEKLLKTVPIIQNQMDALLDFNVSWYSFVIQNY